MHTDSLILLDAAFSMDFLMLLRLYESTNIRISVLEKILAHSSRSYFTTCQAFASNILALFRQLFKVCWFAFICFFHRKLFWNNFKIDFFSCFFLWSRNFQARSSLFFCWANSSLRFLHFWSFEAVMLKRSLFKAWDSKTRTTEFSYHKNLQKEYPQFSWEEWWSCCTQCQVCDLLQMFAINKRFILTYTQFGRSFI